MPWSPGARRPAGGRPAGPGRGQAAARRRPRRGRSTSAATRWPGCPGCCSTPRSRRSGWRRHCAADPASAATRAVGDRGRRDGLTARTRPGRCSTGGRWRPASGSRLSAPRGRVGRMPSRQPLVAAVAAAIPPAPPARLLDRAALRARGARGLRRPRLAANAQATLDVDAELRRDRAPPRCGRRAPPADAPAAGAGHRRRPAARRSTTPSRAPTCPGRWCAPRATPTPATGRSPRPTTASARPGSCGRSTTAQLARRPGPAPRRHRPLRPRLRQRLLGRHPDGVRRR